MFSSLYYGRLVAERTHTARLKRKNPYHFSHYVTHDPKKTYRELADEFQARLDDQAASADLAKRLCEAGVPARGPTAEKLELLAHAARGYTIAAEMKGDLRLANDTSDSHLREVRRLIREKQEHAYRTKQVEGELDAARARILRYEIIMYCMMAVGVFAGLGLILKHFVR